MPFCRAAIGLTLLAAALGAVSVNADAHFLSGPLTGAITVFPLAAGVSNTARLKVQGDGFRMVVANADSGAVDALIDCMPCVPGDEIDLSALFANDDLGEGLVTIGEERLKSAFVAGNLTIRAGTVRVPDRARRSVTLSAPFTVDDGAELQVFTTDFARVTRDAAYLWAHGPISGRGTATIVLTRLDLSDQIAYIVDRIRYAFDEAPPRDPDIAVKTGLIGSSASPEGVTGR
jgi:hypothetical protein